VNKGSGPLLFSVLVNNTYTTLNLGEIVCYADDSYLIFQEDSWNDVCKTASGEVTTIVDWLKNIGMVVNSSKTEAIYFSKKELSGLKIKVANKSWYSNESLRIFV
jgi:hypothetical protein